MLINPIVILRKPSDEGSPGFPLAETASNHAGDSSLAALVQNDILDFVISPNAAEGGSRKKVVVSKSA